MRRRHRIGAGDDDGEDFIESGADDAPFLQPALRGGVREIRERSQGCAS